MCVLCASAAPIHVSASMNYSSTYKGAGRGGYIYTTSTVRTTTSGAGGSMAQAPVASMSSTGSVGGRGISYGGTVASVSQVCGITTVASGIRGGVTTYDEGGHGGPRRDPGNSGDPNEGKHNWVENPDGTFTCTICGITISSEEFYNEEFPDHCVPIGDGWPVALFMALLACAYAIYKVRVRKSSVE